MKFEHTQVFNFEAALRGMRNPMNSWNRADTVFDTEQPSIGANDLKLAQALLKAGSDHSKFMRQIMVSVDITAPMYWFSEFDTYKVGITANSTSKMHKLASTEITAECFEMCDFEDAEVSDSSVSAYVEMQLEFLEKLRRLYNETGDTRYWKELVRWLPCSWLQTRTVTMSYQNIRAMYFARKNHKLAEWSKDFTGWVEALPYAKELITLS